MFVTSEVSDNSDNHSKRNNSVSVVKKITSIGTPMAIRRNNLHGRYHKQGAATSQLKDPVLFIFLAENQLYECPLG